MQTTKARTWGLKAMALVSTLALAACSAVPETAVATSAQGTEPAVFLFGPYKHVPMGVLPEQPVLRGRVGDQWVPITNPAAKSLLGQSNVIALAFASGECGAETWGTLGADAMASANVARLVAAHQPYMISTGGEGGVFTCATDQGFARFLARYASPQLMGIDFDIEATQTDTMIRDLVMRVKTAQAQWPHLRFSFTLATFGASDGSGASLNAQGARVLHWLKQAQVHGTVINLMVMNFGPAQAQNCAVVQGRCDMAKSAQWAVENLQARYGVPRPQIAVTAMLGVNDVVDNVFTTADATALARYAKSAGLAGLHYWSLDRDRPCEGGSTVVSPLCSSLNQVPASGYLQAFEAGLR